MSQKENKNQQTEHFLVPLIDGALQFIFIIIKSIAGLLIKFLSRSESKNFKFLTESHFFKSLSKSFLKSERLVVSDIRSVKHDEKVLNEILENKNFIPIGTDLKNKKPIYVTIKEANQHILVAGATGEGKTTLMTTKIKHAIKHGFPVIIIDPKGDFSDVEKIKNLALEFNRGDKFKLFSLVYPEKSCFYNPLKIGTPEQLKSKLLESLDMNHEYYGSVAAQYLANLFDVLSFLNKKSLTLFDLLKYLSSPNDLGKLDNEIKNLQRSDKVNSLLSKMAIVKGTERKDLAGLISNINAMCLTEFDDLLGNTEHERGEIDLLKALNNKEILYFQLNTPAYSDFASRIGRLILQDLKLVTNSFQSGSFEKKYEFGMCFIDEFGSFASKSFAELLKMIRSSGIGMNLYFQGIADLKAVSDSLAEQVLGNTKVKIILRQDIDTDVETWSSMAGTEDSVIESYQTNSQDVFSQKTGMGNMHEGKKMKVDFDVFKNLNVGQAVVINKGRHTQNLIQIWQQKLKTNEEIKVYIKEKPPLFKSRKDISI